MAQLLWSTPAGSIGIYTSGTSLSFNFIVTSDIPGDAITYTLLNGSLPDSVILHTNGLLSGTPPYITSEQNYTFTVRAKNTSNLITDRTFTMTLYVNGSVGFSTPNGSILNTMDSVYVNYPLQVNSFTNALEYYVYISSGSLPPGLAMDLHGRITGYPNPPELANGSPTTLTYSFFVQIYTDYGVSSGSFSITVRNQLLTKSPHSIEPVLLNSYPLELPISKNDPYYDYYIFNSNSLGTFKANEYFSFKFIGYDFEGDDIIYSFSSLPPGLLGNPTTGWITGTPLINANSITEYTFSVVVLKKDYPSVKSTIQNFTIIITDNVDQTIVWNTDSDLGVLFNGTTSTLYVDATAQHTLSYTLVSGELPPNLTLLDNGSILGKVSFEPNETITNLDDLTVYNFTVKTYLTDFPIVSSTKDFVLTVDKKFFYPTENVYLKATPDLEGRTIINSLLNDDTLIPNEFLYRPEDIYFGKASEVRVVLTYGVRASQLSTYLETLNTNFYNRKIVLGEIKTAQASDNNGNVLYEVVYAEIVDGLITPDGVSIADQIYWPRAINLQLGDYYTSNTHIYTSSEQVYTSSSPGFTYKLYPASLINMRDKIISTIPYDNSQSFLPLWMVSQQSDGGTLGFKQVWVICYTIPGKSGVIKNNINNYWPYKLNQIDFSVDRYLVDKSATYNYNLFAGNPTWTTLPGATPTPDPLNTFDLPVLFNQTNILPNSEQ